MQNPQCQRQVKLRLIPTLVHVALTVLYFQGDKFKILFPEVALILGLYFLDYSSTFLHSMKILISKFVLDVFIDYKFIGTTCIQDVFQHKFDKHSVLKRANLSRFPQSSRRLQILANKHVLFRRNSKR